jgi:hypothetical protein
MQKKALLIFIFLVLAGDAAFFLTRGDGSGNVWKPGQALELEKIRIEVIHVTDPTVETSGYAYLRGLAGENIPLLGRLMVISDGYDALTSERPCKKAFPHQEAVRIIVEDKGTHFDPTLIDVFVRVSDQVRNPA